MILVLSSLIDLAGDFGWAPMLQSIIAKVTQSETNSYETRFCRTFSLTQNMLVIQLMGQVLSGFSDMFDIWLGKLVIDALVGR